MAVTDFSIGAFTFIDFVQPLRPQQQTEIETRPGTDGHSLWLLGNRGQPFELQTVADVADLATTKTGFDAYLAAVGSNVNVIWAGIDMGNFDILSVRQIEARRTLLGIGGTGGSSAGIIRASWSLIATI